MNYKIIAFVFIGLIAGLNAQTLTCPYSTYKLTHSVAATYVQNNGMTIYSSGGCSDRNKSTCTSLDQVNCASILGIIAYKKNSGCAVVITGGTEIGHASGTQSHWNGYKIDISLTTCNTLYIQTKFAYAGIRSDGAPMYKDSTGNIYARESNHWDILYV